MTIHINHIYTRKYQMIRSRSSHSMYNMFRELRKRNIGREKKNMIIYHSIDSFHISCKIYEIHKKENVST